MAKNRAEEYCHELIDCLLSNYEPNIEEEFKSPESADLEMSENSSIEIYRLDLIRTKNPIKRSFKFFNRRKKFMIFKGIN